MSTATFTDRVYEHIFNLLLRRDLRPGDVLDRKRIAEDLNVSLIPVSDAVQRLAHEGFLATRRRQGTFVCSPSIEDVRGQIILREALECQAARLYCDEVIRKDEKRLLTLAKAADKAADSGKQISTEDFNFHLALVELSGCDALADCFKRMIRLSMFHEMALIIPVQQSTYDRHVPLLTALCEASNDEAAARIRHHIWVGKDALMGAAS